MFVMYAMPFLSPGGIPRYLINAGSLRNESLAEKFEEEFDMTHNSYIDKALII